MAAMEGWRDPELQALRPDRVIIIFAIEPDHAGPNAKAAGLAPPLAGGFDRPVHQAPENRDLVAELLDGIVKLLDRLLGGVHGDDRGRGHAVAEIAEIFGRHDIVGPTGGTARLAVADPRHAQPTGRIDDREIEPNLVEAFVQEPREYGGREIAGVLRRMSPERLLADPPPATLLDRHRQDAARAAPDRVPAAHRRLTANFAQLFGKDRAILDPVPVGIDDRMVETGFDLGRGQMGAHEHLLC